MKVSNVLETIFILGEHTRVNVLWVLDPELFREIKVAMRLSGFRKVMSLRTGPISDRNTLQSRRPSRSILHSVLGRIRWEKFRTRPENRTSGALE